MPPPNLTANSTASSCSNSSDCVNPRRADLLHSLIENVEEIGQNQQSPCPISCPSNPKKKSTMCFSTTAQTVWGAIFIISSIIGFIFPPLDFVLWERLNMRPGLPPFDWWQDPPNEVRMRAHIFNVTNHERFLLGLDDKINVVEIGPIICLEKLMHYDIKFHENSTMTYTAKRYLIYLPEENTIDLNATVIVPNIALLGGLSYLHDANYFLRTGFKVLASTHNTQFFVKKTIYEYLWDNRDSVLETSKHLAPSMVPATNVGLLTQIYADFTDDFTVKIGPHWGHRSFFTIDRVRGRSHITGYDPEKCPDRVTGASEGVMYHQHVRKDDVLLCLRKTVCKVVPLHFEREGEMDGVKVYRFALRDDLFDRKNNDTDCYASVDPLPNGISDSSKCFYGFPLVASFPHFYTGSPPSDKYVTGFKPDKNKHGSYIYVEPTTGIPYKAVARLQCNLRVHDLSRYYSADMNKFSNLILPLGWIEYNQEDLPKTIKHMIYFIVVILPPLSTVIFTLTLLWGTYLVLKQIIPHRLKKKVLFFIMINKKSKERLVRNSIFAFEREEFLKKCDD